MRIYSSGEVAKRMTNTLESALIDAREAWTLCGLSKSSWYKNLARGRIPRPVRIGGALRWRRDELLRWIDTGCPLRSVWDTMNAGK